MSFKLTLACETALRRLLEGSILPEGIDLNYLHNGT